MAFFNIAIAVSTVASTAIAIRGQKQAAKAQSDMMKYNAQVTQQSAKFNRDEAYKQANRMEDTAQENMRRMRKNNARELARRRAQAAGAGLKETGAVMDGLLETEDTLQMDIDDLWNRASAQANTVRGQGDMTVWEGNNQATMDIFNSKAVKANASNESWATGVGAVGSVSKSLVKAKKNWDNR